MQKADLINLVITRSPGTPEQLQQLRQQLSAKTTAELEQIADQQTLAHIRADAARQVQAQEYPEVVAAQQQAREKLEDLQFSRIFETPINNRVAVDNQASRSVIRSWITLDEQISPKWFKQILAENPNLAKSLDWQTAKVLDPKYRQQVFEAQDQKDRETFRTFAKANGFADIDANFYLTKSLFFADRSFNEYELADAVKSGKLHLAPASEQQLAQYAQEAAEAHADYLQNQATPQELRDAVRTEADQRRQALQRADQERQIYGREIADQAFGFPPLPEIHQPTGEKIDASWLNKISNTNLTLFKALMRKHGASALTRRLNGRG